MHNMALALQDVGHHVSGSDDEIYDPARSRLEAKDLLPDQMGWDVDRIDRSLDAIILGMHARLDNPELQKAQDLGIPIYSFPQYVFEQAKDKTRVVIAGSHGKTSTTAMVCHVLRKQGMAFDYLVGAQLEGFTNMVQFSDAPIIIIEGDEYLSSPLDRHPKIHYYQPHISVITGIAWDHINVFPTFDTYLDQFRIYLQKMETGAKVIYNEEDEYLPRLIQSAPTDLQLSGFTTPTSTIKGNLLYLLTGDGEHAIQVFGAHNFRNIAAAKQVCAALGITSADFWTAIQSFKGASKRMELLAQEQRSFIYLDFAHAPSKVDAAVDAVRYRFPDHQLIACLELHTFSSLNKQFLADYAGSMDLADEAFVYYSPHTLKMKRMEAIEPEELQAAFQRSDLRVYLDQVSLQAAVESLPSEKVVYLFMTSGKFGGWDLRTWAPDFLKKS